MVLDDPQLKNRAASYISNPLLKSNLHARQAPVLIAVVSDLSENPNPLYRTAVKKFGMYQYDLGAAVQTLCLAAADLGLGSCIMSTIRNKKQLQDLLGIPQGQEICLVVALGYPDGDPAASRERLSLEEICCFNPGIPAASGRSLPLLKTDFRTQKRRLLRDAFFIAFPNPLRHGH
ncbi:MAG: nitroreductase family protein [Acutalibacteraceae bacterium]